MRRILILLVCAACFGLGALVARGLSRERVARPDPPAVVEKVREVARLESLQLSVYKKISFEPDPVEHASLWHRIGEWARFTLRPPMGKAIVFAKVRLGVDVSRLDARSIRVNGDEVEIDLPPVVAVVELEPGETEVIGSNLDSAQTAQLLQLAKEAFEREALSNPELVGRARASAERAIRALLITSGFTTVRFGGAT